MNYIAEVEIEILKEIEKTRGIKAIKIIEQTPLEYKRIVMLIALGSKNNLELKKMLRELKEKEPEEIIIGQIEKIIERFRKYIPVGKVEKKSFGEVFTPFTLVNEMLDTLPIEVWSNPNLKWADLCNGMGNFMIVIIKRLMIGLREWEPNEARRYRHIVENMIYVAELQVKNMFLWMLSIDPKSKLNINIYRGDTLKPEFDKFMKEEWKVDKFDIIVGNPPFSDMLDLDFISKYYDISDLILIVHPSTWLIDEKNKQKKFIKIKNKIGKSLQKVTLFNGNGIFGISLFVPCSITYINKNNKSKIELIDYIANISTNYNDIYDINKYHTFEYSTLKNKINFSNTLLDNLKHTKKDLPQYEYIVNLPQIIGDVKFRNKIGYNMNTQILQDNFYALFRKDTENTILSKIPNKYMYFEFETYKESENFLKYIKTKFVRFCLSTLKNNSQLDRGELKNIPWLDFSQEWNDEKLYSFFNLTDDEVKFIEKVIPKYYEN